MKEIKTDNLQVGGLRKRIESQMGGIFTADQLTKADSEINSITPKYIDAFNRFISGNRPQNKVPKEKTSCSFPNPYFASKFFK
jgi:hypothetical protein